MKCPRCRAQNPETRKFCRECGAKLSLLCPQCGCENLPGDKFCGECGHSLLAPEKTPPVDTSLPRTYTPKHLTEKILTTRTSIEGERKLVTVLFADVANFTNLSEKLDPEEVHQIMDGCFKILIDEIHRYEGTINQFTGDGVMALFGAPVSHEDHAQRACYAGLSIQKAIKEYGGRVERDKGVAFAMRIGINSGPVIVGAIGDDLRMDYTAVGDTTNLAARIQQSARAGEVWLSAHTQGLISGFFEVEPVGSLDFKGKSEPQPVYRVRAEKRQVRTRFEAGLARGVTELVGRRPEMDILEKAWELARREEARVVDVVGEAGVGKSRLAYEFQKRVSREATVLAGVCLHYGRNINFLPLTDMVREALGIEPGMTEEEAGKRIEERAQGSLAPFLPFYRNLLSLKVDDPKFNSLNPEGRKFGTFEAVKNLLFSLSLERPLVLFLEDVHWMDKLSEDFFTFLSRSFLDRPILMLSAYRPEVTPSWAQGSHYQRLGLETLSMNSSIRLVMNILEGLELEPALEGKIAEKAGGNPFFIEEIVRELMERGDLVRKENRWVCRHPIDQLEIPGTIQGVIAARMDRLSEDLKRTMQVASVIGRDFAFRLLKSIMELGEELRGHLTNLVGIEVLYEKALYPELEYIFKHALTQEVAYESLLRQRRREIHGRIGRAIEELYGDKLEPHYELLAHHYELSGNVPRAIEYLIRAGEKSNGNYAAIAAAQFFNRALKLMEGTGTSPDATLMLRLRSGRAISLHAMGQVDEPRQDYFEAIRLARELGDTRMALQLIDKAWWLLYNTTHRDEVPKLLEEGFRLARDVEDKAALSSLIRSEAYFRTLWLHSDEMERYQEALRLANEANDPASVFGIGLTLTVVERWKGNPKTALKQSEDLSEQMLSSSDLYLGGLLSITRAWALTDVGNYQQAIGFQTEWLERCEQNSLYLVLGRICNGLGWSYSEIYDLKKAFEMNKRSLELARRLRTIPAMLFPASKEEAMAEVNLMENKFDMGLPDEALQDILRFDERVRSDPDYDLLRHRWHTRMNDLKAYILLGKGDLEGAQILAEECLRVATQKGMKKYVGKAHRLLGSIGTEKNTFEDAESHLRTALAILEEVGNPKQIWMTRTALARLYEKMNRPDLAREQWHVARAIVESTAEGLDDQQLRTTFLSAAPIREIIQGANP